MSIAEISSELEILARAIVPDLPEPVARAILAFKLDPRDEGRAHELAVKNQGDLLSSAEQTELENYRRAGQVLDLLRSKARMSLKSQAKD